jgi:hypothetical protein
MLSNMAFLVMMRMMLMLLFFATMIIMIMLRLCLHVRKSFEPALQPPDLIQREQSQCAVLQTRDWIAVMPCITADKTHVFMRRTVISRRKYGCKPSSVHDIVPASRTHNTPRTFKVDQGAANSTRELRGAF